MLKIIPLQHGLEMTKLNPIEEALALKKLHEEEKMTWKEISIATGCSVPTIFRKLKLLRLPAEVQNMVLSGKLRQIHALKLVLRKSPLKKRMVRKPSAALPIKTQLCPTREIFVNTWRCLDYFQKLVGRPKENLGLQKIGMVLGMKDGKPELIQEAVLNAMAVIRDNWRQSPGFKDPADNKLIHQISRVRYDYGNTKFEDFINNLKSIDSSSDPINFDSLLK